LFSKRIGKRNIKNNISPPILLAISLTEYKDLSEKKLFKDWFLWN